LVEALSVVSIDLVTVGSMFFLFASSCVCLAFEFDLLLLLSFDCLAPWPVGVGPVDFLLLLLIGTVDAFVLCCEVGMAVLGMTEAIFEYDIGAVTLTIGVAAVAVAAAGCTVATVGVGVGLTFSDFFCSALGNAEDEVAVEVAEVVGVVFLVLVSSLDETTLAAVVSSTAFI
jgi:hypothetical protein